MSFNSESHRFRILFVGRLVKEKKIGILIDAFEQIGGSDPRIVLTIVGDGPENAMLRDKAAQSQYHDRVELLGYVSDFEQLRPIYAESIVSVSPGCVGLSVTQSLAFGVPMLISKDEDHGPEIESAISGFNCGFFETDNPGALAKGLLAFVRHPENWQKRGSGIAMDCARRYSVERMAQGLQAALVGD
jgi:glycosyltransferase involved in cell wall biosynthesis